MPPRYFTPEEANETLETVRPAAERMVAHARRLRAAQARQRELVIAIGGNGGGIKPHAVDAAGEAAKREAAALARCVEEIQATGAEVKDLETGLLDFPALRAGEEVLLCWHVGEPEIGYWHERDAGFAGRRPLPLE